MKVRHWRATMVAALAFGSIATPAVAQEQAEEPQEQAEEPQEMAQPSPYERADDTWISLSGTVESVSPDEFVLDYGDGVVIVEMDDWDADADAYKVVEGDQVTVTGRVDDDLFEMTTIEASIVYVEGLNAYFFASAADEEDSFVTPMTYMVTTPTTLVVTTDITVQGIVTEVSDEEFKIDTGAREITVEVEEMAYDPLDDEGFQKIEVGDYVSVSGESDYDFLEGREIVAETITSLEWED